MAYPKTRFQHILTQIRHQGLRITPQRILILRILAQSKDHPTAEMIHQKVKEQFPSTSLATVYKTINLLKEMDEVLELSICPNTSRYDGNRPYPHPHVACIKCQKIIDLNDMDVDGLARSVSRSTGFAIQTHQLNFYGLCPDCRAGD